MMHKISTFFGCSKKADSPLLPNQQKIPIPTKEGCVAGTDIGDNGSRRGENTIKKSQCRSSSTNLDEYAAQHQQQLPKTSTPAESFTVADDEQEKDDIEFTRKAHPTKMDPKLDAIGKITGQWGKWQFRTVLLIFLCKIPSSWFMACIIFTAPAPRHGEVYCKPPETVAQINHTDWIKISHPKKEVKEDHEFTIDFCNVYTDAKEHAHHFFHFDNSSIEPNPSNVPFNKSALIPCDEFEHQASFQSLITQFDLVCSRDILVAVTQFFHLFGVLNGGILATHLLKHFSPRNVMMAGMLSQIFCGNMTGHVVSYELHVFFRCLSAVCCALMYTAGSNIFMDITGGTYRTVVCTLFEQFWSIGVILLPGLASFFTSWTHLYMAISLPTFILVYLWRWIPDSPRWMICRGRVDEAKMILLECIEVNGNKHGLPSDIDQQLKNQAIACMEAPEPAGWWELWKGPHAVRHMICIHLCWSIYIVVYYGMLLNIRTFSREHLEMNTAIAGCSEIIGVFIGLYFILCTSRKWLLTGLFNIVAGCIAYTAWLIPPEIKGNNRIALLMLSAMISKSAISSTLAILTTCTTELVTDEKKKICGFSTIVWARIWLLCAPYVGATVIFGQLVPQTAFASLAILGGVLTTLISSPRTIPKRKKTTATSNLPPELSPGIWTTKNHDDKIKL